MIQRAMALMLAAGLVMTGEAMAKMGSEGLR